MKYFDPKNDIPSKRVSGEYPDPLKGFLNSSIPFIKRRNRNDLLKEETETTTEIKKTFETRLTFS